MWDGACQQLKDVVFPEGGMDSFELEKLLAVGGCVGCELLEKCELLPGGPLEQWLFFGHNQSHENRFRTKHTNFENTIKNEIDDMVVRIRRFAVKWAIDVYDGPQEGLKKFIKMVIARALADIEYELESRLRLNEITES